MCDEDKYRPLNCSPPPPCKPQPKECDFPGSVESVRHYEIKISGLSIKYAQDDPPPRLVSLEYGQDYMYVRFVHPLLGRIETVPTQLKKAECGGDLQACFDVEISVHIRSDYTSFWNAIRVQEMAAYAILKNQVFDEIAGVAAIPITPSKNPDGSEVSIGNPGERAFRGPMVQPMPVHNPFCKGFISVTVGVNDLGEVPHPKPTCGPPEQPIKFDATKFFEGDLYDGVCRGRLQIEKYYRKKYTYRPGEFEARREVAQIVDETNPIVNSAEMRKVYEKSEERTLLSLRRIENALAESLRNAEDIREAVTCDDVSRGAINRIFEHLHTMYQDTMETNIRGSDGHFSYDTISGGAMMQKLKGTAALKQDLIDQANRLRTYVEREKPHELECFETALAELDGVFVPEDLRDVFNGEYFKEACRPALREDEMVESQLYNFCGDGAYSMHICP